MMKKKCCSFNHEECMEEKISRLVYKGYCFLQLIAKYYVLKIGEHGINTWLADREGNTK